LVQKSVEIPVRIRDQDVHDWAVLVDGLDFHCRGQCSPTVAKQNNGLIMLDLLIAVILSEHGCDDLSST
jgi:hypothetical protein